jgi:hypothetical protein
VCGIGLGGRISPSSTGGLGKRKIRGMRRLIGSDVRWMVVFLRVVAWRKGSGEVRLRTTLRVSLKVASASPIAIAPTPSGPSLVSIAAVG